MAFKTVTWTGTRLSCAGCAPADVILIIRSELIAPKVCPLGDAVIPPQTTTGTNFVLRSIKGQLTSVYVYRNPCAATKYKHTITYDDLQLVPGTTLVSTDIENVVCEGGLTHYIQEQVGEEVKVEIIPAAGAVPELIRLTSQHGCQFEWPAGGAVAAVPYVLTPEDTTTIDTDIFGSPDNIIRAAVKIDSAVGNILYIGATGLRVDCASIYASGCGAGGEINNTAVNTATVNTTATGTLGRTISSSVNVSATAGNMLSVNPDGLYVTGVTETPNTAVDTSTVDVSVSGALGRAISAAVKISAAANNAIFTNVDGLHVTAETANSGADTATIDLNFAGTLGRVITANVKVSAGIGNSIVAVADGIYNALSSADVVNASAPVAGPFDISAIVYTTYGQTGAISLNNPSGTRSMKWIATFNFVTQSIMDGAGQTGFWNHGGEVNINSAGWVNYTLDTYGRFPDGPVGLPWKASLTLSGTVVPGGSVVLEARQTVLALAAGAGSSITGGSTNFTAIGVTV